MNTNLKSGNEELQTRAMNGWMMLFVNLALLIGAAVWLVSIMVKAANRHEPDALWWLMAAVLLEILAIILLCGHFTLQPNEARVLILFGAYRGTVRTSGFWWANPFYSRARGRVPIASGQRFAGDSKSRGGKRHGLAVSFIAASAPRSRCERATSTAKNSRSTTSAATPWKSQPSWSGASKIPPKRPSTWTISKVTSTSRASQPSVTPPASMPTTAVKNTSQHCVRAPTKWRQP